MVNSPQPSSRGPSTLNHLCFCVIFFFRLYLSNATVLYGLTTLYIWKYSKILFQTVQFTTAISLVSRRLCDVNDWNIQSYNYIFSLRM